MISVWSSNEIIKNKRIWKKIIILKKQKINKFLNSLIKLFTKLFSKETVNVNQKNEIKIDSYNKAIKNQLKVIKGFQEAFAKKIQKQFDYESINLMSQQAQPNTQSQNLQLKTSNF